MNRRYCDLGVLLHPLTPQDAFDPQPSKFALYEASSDLPVNVHFRTIAEGLTHGRPWMPTERQECDPENCKQSPSSRRYPSRSALNPQTPAPQTGPCHEVRFGFRISYEDLLG